jgi:pyrroloquinoline quinone biosynthesis protein B
MPGWTGEKPRRPAVSLAVIDAASKRRFLFEATPDFPRQYFELHRISPGERFTLDGVFLTHAHIGHYAGLMFLGHEAMGASEVPVYVMPRMKRYLESNGPWSQLVDFRNIRLHEMADATPEDFGTLKVTPLRVPHRDEFSETVGFRIAGPNRSALFIPDIDKWERWQTPLAEALRAVDYALLDASFFADGELPGRDMSRIPHPFVVETMDLLRDLPAAERRKVWFIHMNHTNPILWDDTPQARQVRDAGFNIAREGLELGL